MATSSSAQGARTRSNHRVRVDEWSPPRLRAGIGEDVGSLVAMHGRCSAETLRRRYHTPTPRLTPRGAGALLEPAEGWSVVAVLAADRGNMVVGIATYAPDRAGMYDVGLLVEDRWQQQGIGTQLLRNLAEAACERGVDALTCATQPDNTGVPRTIRQAGFRPRIRMLDGLAVATFSVAEAVEQAHDPGNKLSLGTTTRHLVPLLHSRQELRSTHPLASMLDESVRSGA